MNLFHKVCKASEKDPKKIAITFEGRDVSYIEFMRDINLIAMLLSIKKLKKGDRVVWLGQNDYKEVEIFFACAKLGMIFVPINWRLSPEEINDILAHCRPSLLIYQDTKFIENINWDINSLCHSNSIYQLSLEINKSMQKEIVSSDDPVLISYTSGSTGKPKGVLISQETILCNAEMSIEAHALKPSDKVLNVLPMFHVGGLNILVTTGLLMGATVFLHKKYDLDRVMLDLSSVNCAIFVPKILQELIENNHFKNIDLSKLRVLSIGSTIVPLNLIKKIASLGLNLVQLYGTTEVTPFAIHQRSDDATSSMGSIGKPGLHCDVKLIDKQGNEVQVGQIGEICVRGKSLYLKYFRDNREVRENDWFRTGDLAKMDDNGNFWFIDRIKNVIISGGENIFPAQIENLFLSSFEFEVAAAVAKADAKWGEVPILFVEGENRYKIDFLKDKIWKKIASYKRPHQINFLKKFPRNTMGKVDLNQLRIIANSTAISN